MTITLDSTDEIDDIEAVDLNEIAEPDFVEVQDDKADRG